MYALKVEFEEHIPNGKTKTLFAEHAIETGPQLHESFCIHVLMEDVRTF